LLSLLLHKHVVQISGTTLEFVQLVPLVLPATTKARHARAQQTRFAQFVQLAVLIIIKLQHAPLHQTLFAPPALVALVDIALLDALEQLTPYAQLVAPWPLVLVVNIGILHGVVTQTQDTLGAKIVLTVWLVLLPLSGKHMVTFAVDLRLITTTRRRRA